VLENVASGVKVRRARSVVPGSVLMNFSEVGYKGTNDATVHVHSSTEAGVW